MTQPDRWAKAVVDGVPTEAGDPEQAAAPSSGPDADAAGASAELGDDDVVEAEIIDVEFEVVDSEAELSADELDDSAGEPDPQEGRAAGDISVEDLVLDLERVTSERDQYLDASRRLQAEFENYRKQVTKRETEARERANDSLVGELLPVLDAFDGAVASGAEDVAPMRTTFLDAMAKQGLERIDPLDAPFDPTLHEAVMHEDADDTDGPVVAEVMRAGYVWKGRVLRPAMVRTRG